MASTTLALSKIRLDGGTQSRVKIDLETVADYAARLEAGDEFPLIEVFHDGSDHWLGDGFHRYHAFAQLQKKKVEVNLRNGTSRDAKFFGLCANNGHGLSRSNKDKRHSVLEMLGDDEWKKWSDRAIAQALGVSNNFVSEIRKEQLSSDDSEQPVKRVGRDGVERSIPQVKEQPHVDSVPLVQGSTARPGSSDFDRGIETEPADDESDGDDEPVTQRKPVAKAGPVEPNVIGFYRNQIDDALEGINSHPPFVAAAVAEYLEAKAEEITK